MKISVSWVGQSSSNWYSMKTIYYSEGKAWIWYWRTENVQFDRGSLQSHFCKLAYPTAASVSVVSKDEGFKVAQNHIVLNHICCPRNGQWLQRTFFCLLFFWRGTHFPRQKRMKWHNERWELVNASSDLCLSYSRGWNDARIAIL